MGLDSVELICKLEQEFGISIPDEDAERIYRVGEMYELIVSILQPKIWKNYITSGKCVSQNLFYQLRQILEEEQIFPSYKFTPYTFIDEIIAGYEKKSHWKIIQNRLGLELPYYTRRSNYYKTYTVRDLVLHLQSELKKRFQFIFLTEKELYRTYKEIIVEQLGVEMHKITYNASFPEDLGLD
jgi:acyl carrier protein